jgi:hypothetical protein
LGPLSASLNGVMATASFSFYLFLPWLGLYAAPKKKENETVRWQA